MDSISPQATFSITGFLMKVGFGGVALLSIGLFTLYKFQEQMIYHPVIPGQAKSPGENPNNYKHPSERAINCETIHINSLDNTQLTGWLLQPPQVNNDTPTVVFFHENAGNIGTRMDYLNEYINRVGCNVMIIAYRGYSDSEGEPTYPGLQMDSIAILNYIVQRKDLNRERIFTHGRSLGGATSVHGITQGKFQVRGVILENTFTSIDDMVQSIMPSVAMFSKFLLKNNWKTVEQIGQIQSPMLFIKSLKDELVPPKHMEILFNQAKGALFKDELVIPEGDHNGNWVLDRNAYFGKIKSFIDQCLSQ